MAKAGQPRNDVEVSDFAPPERIPSPPKHFSRDEKAVWRQLLRDNPLLRSPSYALLVEPYCGALVRRREAAALIAEEGLTVEGVNGVRAHPAVAIVQGAEAIIASLSTKLALASGSRRETGRAAKAASPIAKQPQLVKSERRLRLA